MYGAHLWTSGGCIGVSVDVEWWGGRSFRLQQSSLQSNLDTNEPTRHVLKTSKQSRFCEGRTLAHCVTLLSTAHCAGWPQGKAWAAPKGLGRPRASGSACARSTCTMARSALGPLRSLELAPRSWLLLFVRAAALAAWHRGPWTVPRCPLRGCGVGRRAHGHVHVHVHVVRTACRVRCQCAAPL